MAPKSLQAEDALMHGEALPIQAVQPALAVLALACLAVSVLMAPTAQAASDEAHMATVAALRPRVEWQRKGTQAWPAASEGSILMRGDRLRTGSNAFAELRYGDASIVRVGALSTFTLAGEGRRELRLEGGRVWLNIRKGGAGMRIITPGAVAAVTGTELMVGYDPTNRATEVTVFEGAVEVNGDVGNLVRLQAGTFTRVMPSLAAPAPLRVTPLQVEQRRVIFRALSLPSSTPAPTSAPSAHPTAAPTVAPSNQAPPAPSAAPTLLPESPPSAAPNNTVSPDLRRQTNQLMDPRVLNGSPTTGGVRVIVE